jgi:small subunit ribosomal protein S18
MSEDRRGQFSGRKRKPSGRIPRRKVCRFCENGELYVDYKNYRRLRDYVSERGKIIPRRISGNCAKHQRMLTLAVKRARFMALLSYVRR